MSTDPNTSPTAPHQWATLTLRIPSGSIERDRLEEMTRQLEELAALLAMQEGVTGVETRAPNHARVERPELVIYTTPAALDPLRERAATLAEAFSLTLRVHQEVRDDEDWKDAWKQHYRPLRFGPRPDHATLLVRPSWIPREPDDPKLELVLDPGRAFGTGLHESTQLCMHRLCALAEAGFIPNRILDLGCGSGILALAALRLWPSSLAVACDVDPEAVQTAAENSELNHLSSRLTLHTGDLRAVANEGPFDLIIANIRPEVLVPIAQPMLEVAARPGRAILSGILNEEANRVAAAYEQAGWMLDGSAEGGRRELRDWTGLDLRIRG